MNVSNLFYFGMKFYMFRTVVLSIIRSSRLYIQQQAYVKRILLYVGFQEIEHPPYNPDLAPSDYYLFSKLKKDLRGRKFDDEEEVKSAVMEHFADKGPEYFLKGIEMLVYRCEKCVEVKGDYIENSKVVSFLSPFKVGQAGNLWTLPRMYYIH